MGAMVCGCADTHWDYRAVPSVHMLKKGEPGDTGPLELAVAKPAHHSEVLPERTVLLASMRSEGVGYPSSVYRTVVVMLHGAPKPGKVWLDSENAVLLTYSNWSAPAHQSVTLAGSVDVISVTPNEVVADVAIKDSGEFNQTAWVDRWWDPVSVLPPLTLVGRHTFQVTTQNDPIFEKAAVKWVRAD